MKLYYLEDPSQSGFDFIVCAESEKLARDMAVWLAPAHVDEDELPSVLRGLQDGPVHHHFLPKALAVFTECDPIRARVAKDRLNYLEDCEAALKEIAALSTGWKSGKEGIHLLRINDIANAPSGDR